MIRVIVCFMIISISFRTAWSLNEEVYKKRYQELEKKSFVNCPEDQLCTSPLFKQLITYIEAVETVKNDRQVLNGKTSRFIWKLENSKINFSALKEDTNIAININVQAICLDAFDSLKVDISCSTKFEMKNCSPVSIEGLLGKASSIAEIEILKNNYLKKKRNQKNLEEDNLNKEWGKEKAEALHYYAKDKNLRQLYDIQNLQFVEKKGLNQSIDFETVVEKKVLTLCNEKKIFWLLTISNPPIEVKCIQAKQIKNKLMIRGDLIQPSLLNTPIKNDYITFVKPPHRLSRLRDALPHEIGLAKKDGYIQQQIEPEMSPDNLYVWDIAHKEFTTFMILKHYTNCGDESCHGKSTFYYKVKEQWKKIIPELLLGDLNLSEVIDYDGDGVPEAINDGLKAGSKDCSVNGCHQLIKIYDLKKGPMFEQIFAY